MREYNEMCFNPEEVAKGLLAELLKYLLIFNSNSEGHFCDMHVTSDGYCTIVQWKDRNTQTDATSNWKYISE